LLDGLLAVVLLVLGFVSAIAVFLFGRVSLKLSYDPIRGEVIKLLRAVPLPLHEVAVALEERENEKFGEDNDSTIDDTALVARALREDPALILFSIAQVCMHAAASIPVVEAQIVEPDVVELAEAVIRPPSRPVGARLR
jgi:hypothetical protein